MIISLKQRKIKLNHNIYTCVEVARKMFVDLNGLSNLLNAWESVKVMIIMNSKCTVNSWKKETHLYMVESKQLIIFFCLSWYNFTQLTCLQYLRKQSRKLIARIVFKFFYRGWDKVVRAAVINCYENGGLRVLDLETLVKACRL